VTEVATALKLAESGDFQLYMNNWSGRSDPDGNSVIYQTCGAPQNMGHYCDKDVDAWHQEARAASDPAARKAAYGKIAAKFLAEGWIVYLYHPQILIAHTDRLEGYTPMPDGLIRVVGLRLK
jgi:peptide/nickel transport system substrate-binding protein